MQLRLLPLSAVLLTPVFAQDFPRLPFEDKPMERHRWFHDQRAFPGVTIPAAPRLEALRAARRKLLSGARARMASGPWRAIGPQPTITGSYNTANLGLPETSGRITALAIDSGDKNVIYAGGANGGVWKSANGGDTWTPLSDDQPSLAIGSIALDPGNPRTIYAGTGEANFSGDNYHGIGVLKSTDGGATWKHIPGPFLGPFSSSGGARIGSMAVHRGDGRIVLAAAVMGTVASSGIYRSTDGGDTWNLVLGGAHGQSIAQDPGDANIFYAGLGFTAGSTAASGLYKSTNGGESWTRLAGAGTAALPPATNIGRTAISVAPSNPRLIYTAIQDARTIDTLRGLYRSTDGGDTWQQLPSPDFCAPQCSYNLSLAVHPANPNLIYAGGVQLFRSPNGGMAWQRTERGANGVAVHVDHHAMVFALDGSRLYSGSDGGVWSTDNPAGAAIPNWRSLNAGLSLTQFYPGFSMHPTDPDIIYAGTQDNGLQVYSGKLAWDTVRVCGDAGWSPMDYAVPTTVYTGCFFSNFFKLISQGNFSQWFFTSHGITGEDPVAFIPPQIIDPVDPRRLYVATNRVLQSNDGAGAWTLISNDLTDSRSWLTTLAVAPSDNRTVYAGSFNGLVHVTSNVHETAAVRWENVSQGLPVRSITMLAVDPYDSKTAYVTFSGYVVDPRLPRGHVFGTTDGGRTWADISGDLPNVPANDIAVDPDLPNTLYVATDIGVYESSDGGRQWVPLFDGMPRVAVVAVKLHRPSRLLRAATHGRGFFEASVPLRSASRASLIRSISPESADQGTGGFSLTVRGDNFVEGATVRWNGQERSTTRVSTSELRAAITAADLRDAGRATVAVWTPGFGGGWSNARNFSIGPPPVVPRGGIRNYAGPGTSPKLAPGSLVTISGARLANQDIEAHPLGFAPRTLGGVTVEVSGRFAPLLKVSPNRITFQTPWPVETLSSGIVNVTLDGMKGADMPVEFALYAPGIFTTNSLGGGQGDIRIAGTRVLAAPEGFEENARPARRGQNIDIECTGLGPVSILQGDGFPAPSAPLALARMPEVRVGGKAARVMAAALTPGEIGKYRVTAQVPEDATPGDAVAVQLIMPGAESNTVTMAVQ